MKLAPRLQLRWLLDSPLLIATWAAAAVGVLALVEVAHSLRRAEAMRVEIAGALAGLAAEAALAERGDGPSGRSESAVGDFDVVIGRSGAECTIVVRGPAGDRHEFACEWLAGGAPAVLGQPLVALDETVARRCGEGAVVLPADLPCLDDEAIRAAPRCDTTTAFRADPGVALLQWEGGTECVDFVLDPTRGGCLRSAGCELLVVPGHLWIVASARGNRLRLERDLTVVIEGNLYVGASLQIDGPGRLLLVTVVGDGARPFADRDGNGRWSAGDVVRRGEFVGVLEGGGNVYLGLPTSTEPISLDAGVVAGGEVHVATATAVHGPVVVPYGLTALRPDARLEPTGRRLFQVQRERAPGFVAVGPPRPGLLRPLPAGPSAGEFPASGPFGRQQPLYAAAPAR